jgi:hypothetical protein
MKVQNEAGTPLAQKACEACHLYESLSSLSTYLGWLYGPYQKDKKELESEDS